MSALLTDQSLFTFTPLVTLNGDGSPADINKLLLQIASFVIGTVGILGNGLVIFVCLRYPLRGVTNVFICNQSLIDFFSCVVFLLRYGMVLTYDNLPPDPKAAEFVCKFWISAYPLWALTIASTANLMYLTFERYIVVFYPTRYRDKLTPMRGKLFAVAAWIWGLLLELPWAIVGSMVQEDTCLLQWWSATAGFIVGTMTFIISFILPVVLMSFVYTRIWCKLRTSALRYHQVDAQRNRRISRNVIRTMAIVSLTFFICWAPNQIMYFYNNVGGNVDFNGILYKYSVVSALCNMCVNPFIYTCQYREFRARLVSIWKLVRPAKRICCCGGESTESNNINAIRNFDYNSIPIEDSEA